MKLIFQQDQSFSPYIIIHFLQILCTINKINLYDFISQPCRDSLEVEPRLGMLKVLGSNPGRIICLFLLLKLARKLSKLKSVKNCQNQVNIMSNQLNIMSNQLNIMSNQLNISSNQQNFYTKQRNIGPKLVKLSGWKQVKEFSSQDIDL